MSELYCKKMDRCSGKTTIIKSIIDLYSPFVEICLIRPTVKMIKDEYSDYDSIVKVSCLENIKGKKFDIILVDEVNDEILSSLSELKAMCKLLVVLYSEPEKNEEECMNFSEALKYLKEGKKVARKGWNGKDMWIVLVHTFEYGLYGLLDNEYKKQYELLPWIGIKTADNKFVPWIESKSDLLANNWVIVK